jgi:hypothetical protein
VTGLVERAVLPLDLARSALYRVALRIRPLAAIVTVRDRRVALTASLHALVAFALTVTVPTLLLAIGPILLGVAHVAADLRYLVLRRALPRWWLALVLGFCGGVFALRLAQELGANAVTVARVEYGVVSSWLALALVAGGAVSGRWRRVLGGLPLVVALGLYALAEPYVVRIAFTHLHNLVALGLWMALFRGRWRAALLPLALIATATAVLLSGQTFAWTESLGTLQLLGLHVLAASDWLAPGLPVKAAVGLTLSFAFLQSVHYSTWLLVVPQEDVRGQGTVTFRMAARALGREFSSIGFAALLLTAVVVIVGAFFDLARARNLYLSLAMFHGYLELALGCYFFARGGFGPARASA